MGELDKGRHPIYLSLQIGLQACKKSRQRGKGGGGSLVGGQQESDIRIRDQNPGGEGSDTVRSQNPSVDTQADSDNRQYRGLRSISSLTLGPR